MEFKKKKSFIFRMSDILFLRIPRTEADLIFSYFCLLSFERGVGKYKIENINPR